KILALLCLLLSTNSMATEEIFDRTPEGEIQVRTLPAARWMLAESTGSYFDNSRSLFGRLFNFIKDNEVSMTVPVEGNLSRAEMRFYVGQNDTREFKNTETVRVVEIPERTVVSIGAKGSYAEENVMRLRDQLEEWLSSQSDWVADGSSYAVFWNGPMTLWLFKHYEVHIPIKSAAK
ncbi:MAG: heme-binding protein, partial [Pseudomonadota bacterium]